MLAYKTSYQKYSKHYTDWFYFFTSKKKFWKQIIYQRPKQIFIK